MPSLTRLGMKRRFPQRHFTPGFFRESFERHRSQNNSFVADAFGHALAVKVFKQGNGVFSADAGEIFEASYVEPGRFQLFGSEPLP
jgi:hypothetical protein